MPEEGMNPKIEDALIRSVRGASLIAWALLGALLIELLVEEIVRAKFKPFFGFAVLGNRLSVRYGFTIAAAAAVVLVRILNSARPRRNKTAAPEIVLRRLKTIAVLTLAAAGAPALLGLALFFVGGYNVDFYMLTFVSLVLIFMYFPRRRAWEDRLQDAAQICPF